MQYRYKDGNTENVVQLFFFFFWSTFTYFIFDLAWVCVKPMSVKSPNFIIGHHLVTILYIMVRLAVWCTKSMCPASIDTHVISILCT